MVVSIDSMITDGERAVLRPDGFLDQLPAGTYGSTSFNKDVTRVCAYVEEEQRFLPLPPR